MAPFPVNSVVPHLQDIKLPELAHHPRLPEKILPNHCRVIDRILGDLIGVL